MTTWTGVTVAPGRRRTAMNGSGLSGMLVMAALIGALSGCGGMPAQPVVDDYGAAVDLMKQKKYDDAVHAFQQIIARNDRLAGAYVNLGIAYTELGKRDKAERALQDAVKRSPRNAMAYNQLGIVYRQGGEFAKARDAYEKAISSDRAYNKPYLNLGILCDMYLRDNGCALKNYRKYQSLTKSTDQQVEFWIKDLQNRAGRP